jgi:hypothetical protein
MMKKLFAEGNSMDQFNDNIQPKKKSSVLKWTMIGCGSLLALGAIVVGIGIYFASQVLTLNPAKVEAAAQEMLSFEKPQGFNAGVSMNVAGVKTVVLANTASGSTIVLSSLPPGSNQDATQQNMFSAMEQRGNGKMHVAETRPSEEFKAQGKEVTALINLVEQGGINPQRLLQYVISLRGTSGNTVVLMMMGNEQAATHEWVQRFLDTVKSPPTEK